MNINKVELWQCAGRLETAMRELGVSQIRFSTDHEALERAMAQTEKSHLGEHFARSLHTLPPNRLMWISALDENGNIAAIVAGRLDDTGGWSLRKYLLELFTRVVDGENDKPVTFHDDSTLFAETMSGRCVYFGEFYVDESWRRNGLATLLGRYFMLIAWDEWKPDLLYAWIKRKQIMAGISVIWGLNEMYETPLRFDHQPVDKDWTDTFFVGSRKIGIFQLIQTLKTW